MQVLASLRPEFLDPLAKDPDLAPLTLLIHQIRPLDSDALRSVIEEPAQVAGLSFEPDLVTRLVTDTGGGDALPLLAFTLERLAHGVKRGDVVGLAKYEAMGGMRRVVQTEINEVLATEADLRANQLDQLRAVFIPWLVTINPNNDQPMWRVARWVDLPADSPHMVDALVAKRLLVKGQRGGHTVGHGFAGLLGDAQHCGHRIAYCCRICDSGQFEKPDTVGKFIGQARRDLGRQTGLAHPAHPVNVTNRCWCSASITSATSDWRPMKLVAARRKLPGLVFSARNAGKSIARPGARTSQTGLYGILWDREELAARNGGRVQQSSGQIYVGSHERLAAFRRGEPVSMRAWDVPEAARGGSVTEVMDRLGHSTPRASLMYQGLASGRAREVADALSALAAVGEQGPESRP